MHTHRAIRKLGLFALLIALLGALPALVVTAQPSAAQQATATPIPASDAFIPADALQHYVGIQMGKTEGGAYPTTFGALGDPNAPLKITQLSSYSCAPCRSYFNNVIVNLLPAIGAGQVYYVFIPVTLTGEFDPTIGTAFAFCALDQDKFWPMHELLFNWQARYGAEAASFARLETGALKLGLNLDKLLACLGNQRILDRIDTANKYFNDLNLKVTPSILINDTAQDTPPTLNDIFDLINNPDQAPPTPTDTNAGPSAKIGAGR